MRNLILLLAVPVVISATQRGASQSPRAAAPIDLTGYWVSVVTEDWRWRMLTPPKGDYARVPLNAEGRRVADTLDPVNASSDGCKAYGAAGIMRMPGRLHITWENDNRLKIETDAGVQTRLFYFDKSTKPSGPPGWQGHSIAECEFIGARGAARDGSVKYQTTNVSEGL